MAQPRHRHEDLSPSQRRRVKALLLIRATLVGVVVMVGYYVLPMTKPGMNGTVVLVVGLLAVAGFLAWQIREIFELTISPGAGVPDPAGGNSFAALRFRVDLLRDRIVPDRTVSPSR